MATGAARKIDYDGSIAYDLSRFDKRRRVRDALELEPVAVPRPIAKPGERINTAVKTKAQPVVSASTIIGFIMIGVLMFCLVLNYMRLNELNIKVASLQKDYTELKGRAAILRVENEKKYSKIRIEDLAQNLGMTRPTNDQIVYINMSQPDTGVILSGPQRKTDFLNGIKTFFFAAVDFFK